MIRFRLPEALPPLRGRAARLYAMLWGVMLLTAVAGPIGTAVIMHGRPANPILDLGIDWHKLPAGATAAGLVFGADARAQDVRTGDVLLAVNGRPMDHTGGVVAIPHDDHRTIAVLTLQRAGSAARIVRLPRSTSNVEAFYAGTGLMPSSAALWSIAPFLLTAAFQIFVAILLFQRRREPIAAMLSLGILGTATTSGVAHIFWESIGLGMAASAVTAPANAALFLSLLTFPSGRFEPRWIWSGVLILAVGAFLPPSVLSDAVTSILMLILGLMIATALVWRFLRDRRANGARQWRWGIIGFVTGITFMIAFFVVLQPLILDLSLRSRLVAAWQPTLVALCFAASVISLFGGVALSVLRYRLYGTQAAVTHSILYGGLTLALIAIFAGSEKIIEVLGEEYFGESLGALAGGLGAAFAAIAVGPLHHHIAHWVEHRFRKNLVHLRRDLPPLLEELEQTSEPAKIAQVALQTLARSLHAIRGVVILDGREMARHDTGSSAITAAPAMGPGRIGELQEIKRDPIFSFALRLASDGRSALLVGPRPDDSRYDRQEREALGEIAGPLARALRISADRTANEARNAARFEALERALRSVRVGEVGRSDRH